MNNQRCPLSPLIQGHSVNVPGIDGHAPLHCACTIGYTETVGLLLNQIGIDANVVNKYGDTPLHWAVQRAALPST
ncbi:repeat and LEM domain-containing 2-like [Octopus vulgaris]|uniref:Repeat and LEM domain-containing 2-like n=1 Tax=Octopus vulgaris TaxID=6645 RepID=A0AA36B3U2_OCTVU|nr:repeat and LEM domain-containing 2-like [Octopus vulgaris]